MNNTLLIIDTNNLAHRAMYAQKEMYDAEGFHIGVWYGIMQECQKLEATWNTHHLAFCFDSKHHGLRRAILPTYKGARAEKRELEDDEAKCLRNQMFHQVSELPKLLKQMGALNVFGVRNYECDDLIASIVQNTATSFDLAVIVSGDEDLYQLLDAGRVVQYKPISKKTYTAEMLMDEYGLQPCQWASVKAWAGCASDSVPGLRGVAEKSAAKWLLGKASEKQKALFEENIEMYNRNIQLVKLPFAGCPKLVAEPQETPINWEILAEKVGMPTLPPRGIRV